MISFSIVINTYNRADHLKNALSGLSKLSYDDFEIVVVNGPSTDKTKDILATWAGKIKVETCEEANLAKSRNVGIAASSGDIVAFIDDDAAPHPSWLRRLAEHYSMESVAAVGGYTIDNTGVKFQVKKTVCDRFGNAFFPNDFFDERPLCFAGAPAYPSLLGTNSSFRRSVLKEIGGFDEAFAYLLDETDVCLRIVDLGYKVVYEPDALVYHQFAPSHIRTRKRIPVTLYASAMSKAYFVNLHGAKFSASRAHEEIVRYEDEILTANRWLHDHNEITTEHFVRLNSDLHAGIKDGTRRALQKIVNSDDGLGQLQETLKPEPFRAFPKRSGLNIVLISKWYPPSGEAGIARWTAMMARGLADKGHTVHVVTCSESDASTVFNDGIWIHGVPEENTGEAAEMAAYHRIPSGLAGWCYAAYKKVQALKTFEIDVVSFPIWDVEGIMLSQDKSIPLVMSLHTSYGLAKQFKNEWTERPLFEHFHVNRVIAAENRMLAEIGTILGNSHAIVRDLENLSEVSIFDKTVIAPHGTFDPFDGVTLEEKNALVTRDEPLKVTWVGRFEARKGFDLGCDAFRRLLEDGGNVEIHIVGDTINPSVRAQIVENGAGILLESNKVHFHGLLSRQQLDAHYCSTDVVVMPSRYESFGLVAIEAMAAGAPVIALASGGLAEVVEDGVNGFLLQSDSVDGVGIAAKIALLAKDRKLLGDMKTFARHSFETKFTVDHMVSSAERAYFKAAGREQ